MQTKRHIFEIKQEMNATGWSCITPDKFDELDFFTQQFIMDSIDDSDNFDPINHDIVLGSGHMFWINEDREF
jgi:hypothetical protein